MEMAGTAGYRVSDPYGRIVEIRTPFSELDVETRERDSGEFSSFSLSNQEKEFLFEIKLKAREREYNGGNG